MNTTYTNSTEPHLYVSQGVPGWRTCALCGVGANAGIHKPERVAAAKRAAIEAEVEALQDPAWVQVPAIAQYLPEAVALTEDSDGQWYLVESGNAAQWTSQPFPNAEAAVSAYQADLVHWEQ